MTVRSEYVHRVVFWKVSSFCGRPRVSSTSSGVIPTLISFLVVEAGAAGAGGRGGGPAPPPVGWGAWARGRGSVRGGVRGGAAGSAGLRASSRALHTGLRHRG